MNLDTWHEADHRTSSCKEREKIDCALCYILSPLGLSCIIGAHDGGVAYCFVC